MSEAADRASRHDRDRRREDRSPRQRARRRSEKRSASRSRRRRRRSRSRSRSAVRRQEQRERREREERREQEEREERKAREPSAIVLVHGIPATGLAEDRLEKRAWEMAVQAGSSMPESVQFQYEEGTQTFKGSALVEFPHKEAAKLFKDHANGLLEVDGFNLALKYHHPSTGAAERSRSRSRPKEIFGVERNDPSVTIMIKGISSTTAESSIVSTFQAFATIKDIRHFPRRGFAFIQFHSVDEAKTALDRFDRECRSRLDGERVMAHFAKEREDGKLLAEKTFLQQQALVAAEATAELEKRAVQQAQQETASKALTGVNAEMWANYMQSVAQTETVQSSNTFQYDKESGYYKDAKAGLFYDPNTTYFFTTDCKKYFVYDHEEKMLCHVDAQGQKVPGGERRDLPGQSSKSGAPREARDRERERERSRERERERERRRSRSRRREKSRSTARRREDREREPPRARREEAREQRDRDRDRSEAQQHTPPVVNGKAQPIYFPGGDPLARLAPAADPATPKAPQPKKKKKPAEGVLGLAPVMDPRAVALPGRVTVFKSKKPGAVTVLHSPQARSGAAGQAAADVGGQVPGAAASGLLTAAALAGGAAPAGPPAVEEWICEVCMRKFATEDNLRRHEQLSDLHKENLARLQAAV